MLYNWQKQTRRTDTVKVHNVNVCVCVLEVSISFHLNCPGPLRQVPMTNEILFA